MGTTIERANDATPSGQLPDGGQGSGQPPDNGKGSNGKGGDRPLRITVNLTKTTAEALEETAALTSDTKTDVINKALQFYAFARKLLKQEGAIYVREPGSDEKERLKLL
jgi:hypothetical protein